MSATEELKLGCRVFELEVGTEFSIDEGRTWLVVRTEPRYVSPGTDDPMLRFMAAPFDSTKLSDWNEVELEDNAHVLLERTWGATVKP